MGWGGFGGVIAERPKAQPRGVPVEYVLQPYAIGLSYRGSRWPHTITFELSRDELDSTAQPEYDLSADTLAFFAALGLPEPGPIALVPTVHQMAQKLHALTLPRSDRAHDLVDLQLLDGTRVADRGELAVVTERLLSVRRTHLWPALVEPTRGWRELYQAAREGMDPTAPAAQLVAESLEEAVDRANRLLAELASE